MIADQTQTPQIKTMINAYFGTSITPFEVDSNYQEALLDHQRKCFHRIKDQSFMRGLTVLIGEPGTGKSVFKQALFELNQKQWHIIAINRSIFSWNSFLSLLCQALEVDEKGKSASLEKTILKVARTLNARGKCLIFIIDDAHLIPQELLKRIRMLLEDFPKNRNLVLIGHLELMSIIKRRDHEDILSRITNSAEFKPLSPSDTQEFIYNQLDRAKLPHSTFTHEAIELIRKVSSGNLRSIKNLCVNSMVEAIRMQSKVIDHPQVNRVLDQPHWRRSSQLEGIEPVVFTNQQPDYKDKSLS
jgi:type II secretory pathway predicted ATPase ExeA